MIRLDDLPPGRLRDAALAALATAEADTIAARSGAGTAGRRGAAISRPDLAAMSESSTPDRASTAARARARPPRGRYRCNTCGALSSAYAPTERHADTHGGARIEIVLEART